MAELDGGADVPGSEALRVEDAGEHASPGRWRHYGREEHEQSTIVVVQPGTDQIAGPGAYSRASFTGSPVMDRLAAASSAPR